MAILVEEQGTEDFFVDETHEARRINFAASRGNVFRCASNHRRKSPLARRIDSPTLPSVFEEAATEEGIADETEIEEN